MIPVNIGRLTPSPLICDLCWIHSATTTLILLVRSTWGLFTVTFLGTVGFPLCVIWNDPFQSVTASECLCARNGGRTRFSYGTVCLPSRSWSSGVQVDPAKFELCSPVAKSWSAGLRPLSLLSASLQLTPSRLSSCSSLAHTAFEIREWRDWRDQTLNLPARPSLSYSRLYQSQYPNIPNGSPKLNPRWTICCCYVLRVTVGYSANWFLLIL